MQVAVRICCRNLALFGVFLCSTPLGWAGIYQHGTVVKMHMGDCLPLRHGFFVALGGEPSQLVPEVCPEYTLVSDDVVFVIVGRSSDQLIPLADVIDFRLQKHELAVRVDDAHKEAKFCIKEMVLRSDWELVQKHLTEALARSEPTLSRGR